MKWRRISGATKLLSLILKILKILKNFQIFKYFFFFYKIFPLKIKIFKKPYKAVSTMADEYVHKISSRYLQKWLRYDIKHVKNRHFSLRDLRDFQNFIFWQIVMLQKVF